MQEPCQNKVKKGIRIWLLYQFARVSDHDVYLIMLCSFTVKVIWHNSNCDQTLEIRKGQRFSLLDCSLRLP